MKKVLITTGIITALIIACYLFIRVRLLRSDHSAPAQQSTKGLDLRPLLINKIADLVKNGSDSLYNVSIEKIEPDLLNSTIDLYNVSINADSAAMKRLDDRKLLPDDVFRLSFQRLHISGINLNDLLHTNRIDLDSILLIKPSIDLFHLAKKYNSNSSSDSLTLYQKISPVFKSVSVKAISGTEGMFTQHDLIHKDRKEIFQNVNLKIRDLLIDSSTAKSKDRVFFSKFLTLTTDNYIAKTADSLYEFKIGSVAIDAVQHKLIAGNVQLIPRGNRTEFEAKLKHIDDRFVLKFPRIEFTGINFWKLINAEEFICNQADLYDAVIDDYLDRSLPSSPGGITIKNFPQQQLQTLSLKVNIEKLNVHNANFTYEEFAPESGQSGTISFDDINGTFDNVTNMPDVIAKNGTATVKATAKFMKRIPVNAAFSFALNDPSGGFTANLNTGEMDSSVLNAALMPLGLLQIKKGTIKSSEVMLRGNNAGDSIILLMPFDDLHITPLKKTGANKLKKKRLLSFFANTFILKSDNPSGNHYLTPVRTYLPRGTHGNFFNFGWNSIRKGILKTIGVPGN